MPCPNPCSSPNPDQVVDNGLEKKLREDYKNELRIPKILLLGAGESGKSTFVKQVKIIHGRGYGVEDRLQCANHVYQNIFTAVQTMIAAMHSLHIEFDDKNLQSKADRLTDVDVKDDHTDLYDVFLHYVASIQLLWDDYGMKKVYKRRNEYQLSDSAEYFLDNLCRIGEKDYVASDDDILRVRIPTTTVVTHDFCVKSTQFRLIDVAGQRGLRHKWIHAFDKATTILFLVAISEYDQVLMEEDGDQKNRLEESHDLFSVIVSYECFKETPVILFLNKKDLLEQKITHSSLSNYFPEFTGPEHDCEAAKKFILNMFRDVCVQAKKVMFSHFTCAIDTRDIRVVFDAIKDIIITSNVAQMLKQGF